MLGTWHTTDSRSTRKRTPSPPVGRKTFQKMAAFWPLQPDTDPIAAHLNATPTFVATRKLTSLDWEGAEGEGAITILGSGALVHELMQLHLVDGFRLFVHPLLLGTGKRLSANFPSRVPCTSSVWTRLGS